MGGGGGGGQPNFVYVPAKKPKYAYTKINKNTHGILFYLELKPNHKDQLCIAIMLERTWP